MSDPVDDQMDRRLQTYLQARADVRPDVDLTEMVRAATQTEHPRPRSLALAGLASAAVIVIAVGVVVGSGVFGPRRPSDGGPGPVASGSPGARTQPPVAGQPASFAPATSAPDTAAPATAGPATDGPATAPPSGDLPASVPATVLGLPVISVSEAIRLRNAGSLDGRAVAVGGYYDERSIALPCPAPMIESLLTEPCVGGSSYLMEQPEKLEHIESSGDQTQYQFGPPVSPHLATFFQTLSAGFDPWRGTDRGKALDPKPVVLIGHVGDPVAWVCPASQQDGCTSDFVVDRFAWADGSAVDEAPADSGVVTRMSRADAHQAVEATGPQSSIVGLQAMSTGGAQGQLYSIDPRVALAPDQVVWVARVLSGDTDEAGTRRLDQIVLDDATGHVLDRRSVATAPEDAPATVFLRSDWVAGSPNGSPVLGYELRDDNGRLVVRGPASWIVSPLVLAPGSYELTFGWTQYSGGLLPPLHDTCTAPVDLESGQQLWLTVTFDDGPCTVTTGQEPG